MPWRTTTEASGTASVRPVTGKAEEQTSGHWHVLGKDPFRDDVFASGGLDDRMSRGGYLTAAEDLMAEAVPYPPGDGPIPAVRVFQFPVGHGEADAYA
jgi:hypothetical protein